MNNPIRKFPECRRCGRRLSPLPSGRARAHKCPHGNQCVTPVKRGIGGVFERAKAARCLRCFQGAQLPLLFEPPPPLEPAAPAPPVKTACPDVLELATWQQRGGRKPGTE